MKRVPSILFVVGVICISASAFAQTAVVKKVRGRKAVIQFEKKTKLKAGESINIKSEFDEFDEEEPKSRTSGEWSRANSLSVEANIGETKTKVESLETSVDLVSLSGTYLRNFGIFEVGGGLLYSNSSTDSSKTTTSSIIGVGQYNIISNDPGVMFVPAVELAAGISNYKVDSQSGSGFLYSLAFKMKMFPWNDSFALFVAAGIQKTSIDVDDVKLKTDQTGLTAGVSGYF